jgi:ubiquinone/menaquinone biosynthesis C-methylase UbiE
MDRENRKEQEESFFDQLAHDDSMTRFYDRLNNLEFQESFINYFDSCLGDIRDKLVLEYGCGNYGDLSLKLIRLGAKLVSVDISGESVKSTYRLIKKCGLLHRVSPMKMDCEVLCFADASFDLVVGRAILHHLNLRRAIPEIRRVLKPGGTALFIEPLGMNPLLNLYRKLTPKSRTKDEHPLTGKDFKELERYFPRVAHREFNLLSLPIILMAGCFKNKTWLNRILPKLERADKFLFKHVPCLARYGWTTVISLSY